MKIKKCSVCEKDKPITEFYKDNNSKDGHWYKCIECSKRQYKENKKYTPRFVIVRENEELLKDGLRKCSKCKEIFPLSNFLKNDARKQKYESLCKGCRHLKNIKQNKKKPKSERCLLRKENDELIKKGLKKCYYCKEIQPIDMFRIVGPNRDGRGNYCSNCKDYDVITQSTLRNRDKAYARSKIWCDNNKEWRENYTKTHREEINANERERRKNDINYRIACNLRCRIRSALRGKAKKESTFELLSCDIDFFKKHLESLFQPEMTWDNYGEWEIDHILPCDAFVLQNSEEREICFAWWNMQPMWGPDNSRKNNKIV